MNETQIKEIIIDAYKNKYKKWDGISVSSLTKFKNGLNCVVNVQQDDYGNPFEEMCFVKKSKDVTVDDVLIFSNTNELVHHIEKHSSIKNWLFSGEAIAAIAFILLLLTFISSYLGIILFEYTTSSNILKDRNISISNKDIFEVLKSIFSLAAGYFLAKKF